MICPRHLLLSAAALVACEQPPGRVGTGTGGVMVLDVKPDASHQLDVLFVIDNSGSMQAQQAALVEAARDSLFGQLVDEHGQLPDLHVGVVSTNVGSARVNIGGCSSASRPDGDDGGLLTNACEGISGQYLVDEDDGAGGRLRNYTGDLADTFGCMANLGTAGCGFEQPLAAAVRAVESPFNVGFLRPDALLLIVMVTDEDDCSTADPVFYGEPNGTPATPLGARTSFRCFDFGVTCAEPNRELGDKTDCVIRDDSYLTPVDDLVARLRAVKADPSLIMVAGIHGGDTGVTVVPDVDDVERPALGTVCTGTDFEVTPALRLTAFGEHFPSRWVVMPPCLAMSAKIARIIQATTGVLGRATCLLGRAPDLDVCEVTTVARDGARTAIPRCDLTGSADCYRVEADAAACSYTEHKLRLIVPPALVPEGRRLQMQCGG